MTDIEVNNLIKRLRMLTSYGWSSTGTEAADEIERLRADLADMSRIYQQHKHDAERLRAALDLIAMPRRPDGTYNRCREACEELARAALEKP